MSLFTNPEIVRNARIQLCPKRMILAGVLCAALSLAIGYAYAYSHDGLAGTHGDGFFRTILILQGIVLVAGGGITCLHAIQREKDQNTFDFQRLTRLSPLELTTGKLFGAPLMAVFVFLCFIPAAIVGAVAAHASWTIVLAAYVLLILGSIAYDAFALVISLFLRRGTATWAILGFLMVVGGTSGGFGPTLGVVSPFVAVPLVQLHSWDLPVSAGAYVNDPATSFRDLFFGFPVHHALVAFGLYVTVLAWFIPAIARNIKRDPGDYELYTPPQALGFLCYLNFIVMAFCQWQTETFFYTGKQYHQRFVTIAPLDVQSALLAVNIGLFFVFGFILLRNRNQVRRYLHGANRGSIGRLETWPAPYILLGALIVGAAMVGVIQWKRDPALQWNLTVAIFRVIYFAAWISCDLLFLQWMNLRRGRHPLPLGVLYLSVYYVCAGLVIGALHLTQNPFTAIFLPTPLWELNTTLWSAQPAEWIVALLAIVAVAIVFIFLQRQQVSQLQPRPVESRAGASVSAS